jgi:hypothetical protein
MDDSDRLRRSHVPWIILIIGLAVVLSEYRSGSKQEAVEEIIKQMENVDEYSIILKDMQEQGNFFKEYQHKYSVVQDSSTSETDWMRVSKEYYNYCLPLLGMTIVTKTKDKGVATVPQPPMYNYVGDSRYGQWKQDSNGNSFWEFYGKYMLLSQLFGMGRNLIYRNDYDDYRRSYDQGRPYYGKNNQYGTGGTITQETTPNFFERKKNRETQSRSTFLNKFNSKKSGRSMASPLRGRAGGFGK